MSILSKIEIIYNDSKDINIMLSTGKIVNINSKIGKIPFTDFLEVIKHYFCNVEFIKFYQSSNVTIFDKNFRNYKIY
jgi:hypothetical protein